MVSTNDQQEVLHEFFEEPIPGPLKFKMVAAAIFKIIFCSQLRSRSSDFSEILCGEAVFPQNFGNETYFWFSYCSLVFGKWGLLVSSPNHLQMSITAILGTVRCSKHWRIKTREWSMW